jgi:hypothetical protein
MENLLVADYITRFSGEGYTSNDDRRLNGFLLDVEN